MINKTYDLYCLLESTQRPSPNPGYNFCGNLFNVVQVVPGVCCWTNSSRIIFSSSLFELVLSIRPVSLSEKNHLLKVKWVIFQWFLFSKRDQHVPVLELVFLITVFFTSQVKIKLFRLVLHLLGIYRPYMNFNVLYGKELGICGTIFFSSLRLINSQLFLQILTYLLVYNAQVIFDWVTILLQKVLANCRLYMFTQCNTKFVCCFLGRSLQSHRQEQQNLYLQYRLSLGSAVSLIHSLFIVIRKMLLLCICYCLLDQPNQFNFPIMNIVCFLPRNVRNGLCKKLAIPVHTYIFYCGTENVGFLHDLSHQL